MGKHSLELAAAGLAGIVSLTVGSAPAQAAEPVVIHFESLPVGMSVEGPGIIDPLLTITSGTGAAAVLGEGMLPATYGAPNGVLVSVLGGCLGNPGGYASDGGSAYGQGFADTDPHRSHEYTFEFPPDVTVSEFSISMLDFGDLNPTLSTYHEIRLVAYDADDNVVDEDILSYTSTAEKNPRHSLEFGDLYSFTGDACMAQPGEPGNYLFHVGGAGITKVGFYVVAGLDPNIAFDNIKFTACEDADGDTVCDDVDICPSTTIPEAVPTDRLLPNHYALVDADTVFDTIVIRGQVPQVYTVQDTRGCSCEQIICGLDLNENQRKGIRMHGCPQGIMAQWTDPHGACVNPNNCNGPVWQCNAKL